MKARLAIAIAVLTTMAVTYFFNLFGDIPGVICKLL
jgi:hypothetical protein